MIVEYAEHGCLRDYLRSHANESQSASSGGTNEGYERPNSERPTISEKQLISFARQVGRKHNKKFSLHLKEETQQFADVPRGFLELLFDYFSQKDSCGFSHDPVTTQKILLQL